MRLVRRIGHGPVLDVGAAQGFLGQTLQPEGTVLDAVEPHPYWAAHAEPFYRRVFASGIEQAPLPEREYGTVVCADVLEHTVDPVAVLRTLQRAAVPGALFVISLPNVAHLAARLLLLGGRFPQMERGIFDRTHLHFYTRATATAMLEEAGLQVLRVRPTPVPLEQVWPPTRSRLLLDGIMAAQHTALLVSPTLFGFQWVMVARAPGS